jgi:ATP adenylyltransferase
MKQLWAPWRMEYIQGPRQEGCIFCFDPDLDDERYVLKRTGNAFVLLNKYPYTNGHLLVVPARHVGRPQDLPADEFAELNSLLLESLDALDRSLHPHGMNVGMNLGLVAGAGVDDHMHFHIVPRWNGDHNYMAVLGEVRMINQHLLETWRQLKPAFGA